MKTPSERAPDRTKSGADATDPKDPQADAPAASLREMIMGFRTTQLIYVAARLGISDLLEDGPQDIPTLASAAGAHPSALYRLLRALASLGIFAETHDGRFELTPLAATLRSNAPGSLRDMALLYGDGWLWRAYGDTLYSVATGAPAFEHVHGQPFFEYLRLNPEAASVFDGAMTAFSEQESGAVLAAYDFSWAGTVVDVGGGRGALLAAILKAHPRARGILFDRPGVIDSARETAPPEGVADRFSTTAGDFFQEVPVGGDLYVLKSVLHDWNDARSVEILKNCRAAMQPASRLLVIERVVPEGNQPAEAKLFDINMLVVAGGAERTRQEYGRILAAGGFELTGIFPTRAPMSIVEGTPRAA